MSVSRADSGSGLAVAKATARSVAAEVRASASEAFRYVSGAGVIASGVHAPSATSPAIVSSAAVTSRSENAAASSSVAGGLLSPRSTTR